MKNKLKGKLLYKSITYAYYKHKIVKRDLHYIYIYIFIYEVVHIDNISLGVYHY